MGLFDFLKSKQQPTEESPTPQPALMMQGPAYLRPYLKPLDADLHKLLRIQTRNHEWVGQLVSGNNNCFFSIRFFGNLLSGSLIVSKDRKPQKTIAVVSDTQEEILLFDKALHGWDGFICNCYESEKADRPADTIYTSKTGTTKFRIVLLAIYSEGTHEELPGNIDKDGNIELENGIMIPLQDAFDNAFDGLVVYAIDENGKHFELINEELA